MLSQDCLAQGMVFVILYNLKLPPRVLGICNRPWAFGVVKIILSTVIDESKSTRVSVIFHHFILHAIRQTVNTKALSNVSDTHVISLLSA